MSRTERWLRVTVALVWVWVAVSCSDDSSPKTEPCEHPLTDGSCAGVTRSEICASPYCTGASSCLNVWHVQQGASAGGDGSTASPYATLEQGAKRVVAGDCIALASGSYSGVTLAGGVSLLGTGAQHVTISNTAPGQPALSMTSGTGALLRGFTLSSAGVGLRLRDSQGTVVDQVKVALAHEIGIDARRAKQLVITNTQVEQVVAHTVPPSGDAGPGPDAGADGGSGASSAFGVGVLLAQGSSARLTQCAIQQSATQGVLADGSSIVLEESAVTKSGLFGVVIQCAAGCAAAGSEIRDSVISYSQGIGLLVSGVKLTATGNDIGHTQYAAGLARAVQIQLQAAVTLQDNVVHHSAAQGIVLDDATGTLDQNRVENNQERGIWLQHVATPGVVLSGNIVTGNQRAGIGATLSTAVTISGGRVEGTRKLDVSLLAALYQSASPPARSPWSRHVGVTSRRKTNFFAPRAS